MSYIKLGTQKEKHTNTNMANRLSVKKLQEMMGKTSSNKIKSKIRVELDKRAKNLKKQAKMVKK